mgnify:CR=1 FL=1
MKLGITCGKNITVKMFSDHVPHVSETVSPFLSKQLKTKHFKTDTLSGSKNVT